MWCNFIKRWVVDGVRRSRLCPSNPVPPQAGRHINLQARNSAFDAQDESSHVCMGMDQPVPGDRDLQLATQLDQTFSFAYRQRPPNPMQQTDRFITALPAVQRFKLTQILGDGSEEEFKLRSVRPCPSNRNGTCP